MPGWLRWLMWRVDRAEKAADAAHRAHEDGTPFPPRPRWLPRCRTITPPWRSLDDPDAHDPR